MTWVSAALGLAQTGLSIYQMIDQQNKEEAAIDEEKKRVLPDEYNQSKALVKDLYAGLSTSKNIQRAQAADLAVSNRAMIAGTASSASARLQADLATNVELGKAEATIWDDYRKAKSVVVNQELAVNSDIGRARMEVENQNFQLAQAKQDMYNIRQAAWGELLNAGISNTVGAIQSNQNDKLMRDVYGLDPKSQVKLENKAIDAADKGLLTSDDLKQFQDYMKAGQVQEARLLLLRKNID